MQHSSSGNGSGAAQIQTVNKACYHCDQKAVTNYFCETWKVWSCTGCAAKHHRAHHNSCDVIIPREAAEVYQGPKYFGVWFTRYDGQKISFRLKLGDKLELEDHWLGTYVLSGAGMVLVQETRDLINERILQGLALAK